MDIKRLNIKMNYISNFLNKKFKKININNSEFVKDAYYLNKLIHEFYLISKSNLTKNEKIDKLANQTDPYGNKIINKEIAQKILDNNSKDIVQLYNKLYSYKKNQKSTNNFTGGSEIFNNSAQQLKNLNNSINNNLKKIKLKEYLNVNSVKSFNMINHFMPKSVSELGEMGKFMINWIFFPLWSMENLPIVGQIIEIPLDLMGIMIDNFDVLMDSAGSSVTLAIDIILDILQAVPIVGTFASAIALPMDILEQPIEYIIENGTDLIGMFFNLSRKQYGLAYVSSLSAIPYFTDIVDAIVTNLFTANKFVSKINKSLSKISGLCQTADNVIRTITENSTKYRTMFSAILNNPKILYNVDIFIKEIIIPSKNSIPYLKNMDMTEFLVLIKNIKPIISKFVNNPFYFLENEDTIYNELIKPFKNNIPILKDMTKTQINNEIFNYINIALNQVNTGSGYIMNNLNNMIVNKIL